MAILVDFPHGDGIFETLLTRGMDVAELNRHMRRAIRSAALCNIDIPSEETTLKKIGEVLRATPCEWGRLRLTFSIEGFDIQFNEYQPIDEKAVLTFSQITVPEGEQIKKYPYDHRLNIVKGASDQGFTDAITFNGKNMVCETGIANIAFFLEGQWLTPPISAGILPGVMRALAIERCDVSVRDIHISEIPNVSAAVLLSSLRISQPVAAIGDYVLPQVGSSQDFSRELASKVEFFSVG